MAKAFADLTASGQAKDIPHADWLALLLDRETSWRRDKRLTAAARRKTAPAGERRGRRLSRRPRSGPRPVPEALGGGMGRRPRQPRSGRPIRRRQELVGLRHRPEGVPRQSLRPLSSLAKALRRPGARPGRRGRHPRLIKSLGRADLLILDDFGLEPLDAGARHDLLEILEERYGRRSTIVTSQLPLSAWHEVVGDPTYADAILDRLVHNAHRIELTGESLRRTRGKQLKTA